MVACTKYSTASKITWDDFVKHSKTPLFFFNRDFLEYHADRFEDCSLMFYEGECLVAVLPASAHGKELVSHGGLTYGGLILSSKIRAEKVLDIFSSLVDFVKLNNFERIIYKSVPYIFYKQGAQEDAYALFRHDATLYRRDLSSVVYLNNRMPLSKGRKWLIARAKKHSLTATTSENWLQFYDLLTVSLGKHSAKPVHTPEELKLLFSFFPENISLRVVEKEGALLAATLLFKFDGVTHTQYMATNDQGKEVGALDYLIESCIEESKVLGDEYFSFGVSTEEQGLYLNSGLISQKESFGARGMVVDFYEILSK